MGNCGFDFNIFVWTKQEDEWVINRKFIISQEIILVEEKS